MIGAAVFFGKRPHAEAVTASGNLPECRCRSIFEPDRGHYIAMRFDDGPRPTVALQCAELIGEPRSEDGWHSSDAAVAGGDNRRVDREERAKMLGSHQRLVAECEQNPRAGRGINCNTYRRRNPLRVDAHLNS